MAFTLSEILKWTGGELLISPTSFFSFDHISIDSRTTQKGDLFIAIKGKRFDGHDFLPEALAKGARGAIISRRPEPFSLNNQSKLFLLIKVKDTLPALQALAGHYRQKFNLKVIAVTGSNGKTTTKDLIFHLLKNKFSVLKSSGNYNNQIGLPLSILEINEQHEVAVLELGMSGLGEIKALTALAQPQFGIITNVGPVHLEFLGRLENVAKAKAELIESLSSDDTAILNNDDPYVSRMKKMTRAKIVTFGIKRKADFQARDISHKNFSHLTFKVNGMAVSFPLLGQHNIYSVLAASALARLFGLSWELIGSALSNFSPAPMRMELKQIAGLNIINDAYNANPDSMKAALETLLDLDTGGRKILVFGDMLELGNSSRRYHQKLGEKIGKSGIDYLLTVGNLSCFSAQEAIHFGLSSHHIFHSSSAEEALPVLKGIARSGDIILIKGSRAMQLERIVEKLSGEIK